MANPLKGEVSVEVEAHDDEPARTLTLVYDFEALVALEDALDKSILEILPSLNRGLRLRTVRALFWAGLRAQHPEITLPQAGELVGPAGGMLLLADRIFEAVGKAFPAPAKASEAPDATGPRNPPAATAAGTTAETPTGAGGTPSTASDSGSSTT